MDYQEAVDYLLSFTDLERGVQRSDNPSMSVASVRSLLSRLNNPHYGRFTVHVTGSKGKGTTSAMVAAILRRAGHRTALFSSPHLHDYTERIAIDGDAVTPAEFAAALTALQPAIEDERASVHGNVSTFGILTALFFWLARAQVPRLSYQVVEVGLGGTYDATNVLPSPEIAVITPISLEHTAILGRTTVEIARDKSGIIKNGTTCVLAPQRDPAVADVVRERCEAIGAELIEVGAVYETELLEKHEYGQAFVLRGPGGERRLRTPMLGRHQLDNAATAVAVADALRARGHDVPPIAVEDGIARTRVRGRMELMGQAPLILADGAHNGESMAALAGTLRDYLEWKRCFLVLGTMRDKDLRGMGAEIAELAELIICTRFESPRAREPREMIEELGALGRRAIAAESVGAAIDTAIGHANADDLICITGSLYVVAEARAHLLGRG